jgi:hypothetical protein
MRENLANIAKGLLEDYDQFARFIVRRAADACKKDLF